MENYTSPAAQIVSGGETRDIKDCEREQLVKFTCDPPCQ